MLFPVLRTIFFLWARTVYLIAHRNLLCPLHLHPPLRLRRPRFTRLPLHPPTPPPPRASDVRPQHSAPTISVNAPTGTPPPTASSTAPMPVDTTGLTIRLCGVSAPGILRANAASTCERTATASGPRGLSPSSPSS